MERAIGDALHRTTFNICQDSRAPQNMLKCPCVYPKNRRHGLSHLSFIQISFYWAPFVGPLVRKVYFGRCCSNLWALVQPPFLVMELFLCSVQTADACVLSLGCLAPLCLLFFYPSWLSPTGIQNSEPRLFLIPTMTNPK